MVTSGRLALYIIAVCCYGRRVRDALVATGRVLREACWLAAERLRWRGDPSDIPAHAASITPGWLTRILQPYFPGCRVRSLEQIAADAGTTDRARLAVTYDDLGSGDPPPASLFVKLAPADFKTRLLVNLMRLGATEVAFYRQVAAWLPVDTPRVFYAHSQGRAQRFILVLEDLSARAVRFTTVAQALTLDDARVVMQALARLHAHLWDSPRFNGDLAWLKSRDHNPNERVERCLCALAMRPGIRRFPDLVPRELQAATGRIAAARARLENAWAHGPLTVIHGDAHVGNLYFSSGTAGFLDWQVVQRGQGMRDVAYFVINSVPTELRRAHQRDLIALYLSTLAEHGVSGPDPETAWQQYRLHALYTWIATVVTAAAATLQVEPIVRAGLARSSHAVMDLDSLGALDEVLRLPSVG
ncbi:MAG: phosphotransferase [Deltaproteobacteria bacterium]|nr:phosphotransferase [Deltaproteobacteria bacterium]MBI3386790.1 phosphotransferase [Deltaproteobacteria bacterium]